MLRLSTAPSAERIGRWGDFSKAIEYHTQDLAIATEVGDRAGEGQAYGNLGNAYHSLGDFSNAIEYHTQALAIATEVGDRAGEGAAYGNLGNAYQLQGEFSKAIAYHKQCLAIANDLGDGAREGAAYGNLGTFHMHVNEHVKAVAYFEAQHALAISLKLTHVQSHAELNMGVASGQVDRALVGKRGARTRRCSRAAAAVWRAFAAQITKRWLRKKPYWAGV
jgi:tetratricopeptide (TPR) repeat protein